MKKLSRLTLVASLFITSAYAATPGTIQWTYNIQGAADYAPAVAADGTIYASAGNQFLWAINSNGTKKWATYTQYPLTSSPVVSPDDGSIFVSANTATQGYLYKFTSSGTIAWMQTIPVGHPPISIWSNDPDPYHYFLYPVYFNLIGTPTISNNLIIVGNWLGYPYLYYQDIFIISTAQRLSFIDPETGNVLYQDQGRGTQQTQPNHLATIPLSWIHTPYINFYTNPFYDVAITSMSDTDVNYNLSTPTLVVSHFNLQTVSMPLIPAADTSKPSSPVGGANGIVYVGDTGGNLFKYDESGNLLATIHLHGDISKSAPVVAPNGVTYVGSTDGDLYAVDPDGTLDWHTFVDSAGLDSSAVINKDGVIYITGASGQVYALSPQGQLLWNQPVNAHALTAPAIGPDGTLYVGDSSGDIVAINGEPLSKR